MARVTHERGCTYLPAHARTRTRAHVTRTRAHTRAYGPVYAPPYGCARASPTAQNAPPTEPDARPRSGPSTDHTDARLLKPRRSNKKSTHAALGPARRAPGPEPTARPDPPKAPRTASNRRGYTRVPGRGCQALLGALGSL